MKVNLFIETVRKPPFCGWYEIKHKSLASNQEKHLIDLRIIKASNHEISKVYFPDYQTFHSTFKGCFYNVCFTRCPNNIVLKSCSSLGNKYILFFEKLI